jgi:hypothetical protein
MQSTCNRIFIFIFSSNHTDVDEDSAADGNALSAAVATRVEDMQERAGNGHLYSVVGASIDVVVLCLCVAPYVVRALL